MVSFKMPFVLLIDQYSLRLCDIRFTSVKAKLKLDNVPMNSQTGDFNTSSLANHINVEPLRELVVKSWIDRACEVQFHHRSSLC